MTGGIAGLPIDEHRRAVETCDRFERAWTLGGLPAIEAFLDGFEGSSRDVVRAELEGLADELGRSSDHREKPRTPAEPPAVSADSRVGDFDLLNVIGRGGMGVVYKARQRGIGRLVALKLIRPELIEGPGRAKADGVVARFLGEARAAGNVHHENIVVIHAVGEDRGRYYYAMRYVEGSDLAEVIRDGPVAGREAAAILEPVARAIGHAHRSGVIHRDLKPRNILLDRRGRPFVTDFGLAKILGEGAEATRAGGYLGSPPYMAPEQIRDARNVRPSCDIYSLGATLYELITGRPPFRAADPIETLRQSLDSPAPPPRTLNPAIDRDLETICLKCIEKEPGARYATAEDCAEDLRRYLAGEPIAARPASTTRKAARWVRRHPTSAALWALAVSSVSALGLGWSRQAVVEREHAVEVARAERLHAEESRALLYDAEINLAYNAHAKGRVEQARQILDGLRPTEGATDLRGFEWHHLWRESARELALRGHEGSIRALAFSPDGLALVSAGSDRSIRVWDAGSWRQLDVKVGHSRLISSLAFSPDGSALFSGSLDGSILRWADRGRGAAGVVRAAGSGSVLCLAPSADGRTLAACVGDRVTEVILVDAETGAERMALSGHSRMIACLRFSPKGDTLAGAGADGKVYAWDPARATPRLVLDGHPGGTDFVEFTRDGRSIVSSGADRAVRFWDVETGALLGSIVDACPSAITSLALGGGDRVVAVGHLGGVSLWDRSSRRRVGEAIGGAGTVRALAFSPTGPALASGGDGGVVRLWDTHQGRPVRALGGPGERWGGADDLPEVPQSLAYSADGRQVAVGFDGGIVEVRDVGTGAVTHRFSLRNYAYMVRGVAFLDEGRSLAASGDLVPVRVWDLETGRERISSATIADNPEVSWWSVVASPDGRTLILAPGISGKPSRIAAIDSATGREVFGLAGHEDYVRSLAIDPTGSTLASGSGDETVRLWDLKAGFGLATLRGHRGQVFAVAINPAGSMVASGSEDQTVRLWDVAGRREVATLRGHESPVHSVAFSPDGRRVASGARDGSILLWDAETRRMLARLEGHAQRINQLAFAPDGRSLISASYDRSILVHDAEPVD